MTRAKLRRAQRGSHKWLQRAIELEASALNKPLADRLDITTGSIHWLSPLAADDFAEYRDHAFLDRLGIELAERDLASFWPRRGPQWDGLGRTDRGDLILIEAKAHIGEMVSPASVAIPTFVSHG